MLKYIFMGTPPLAVTILDKVVQEYGSPVAVVTQTAKPQGRGQKIVPSAVETYAHAKGLIVFAVDNINTDEMVLKLRSLEPDLCLVAAFGQILKETVLRLPRLYCLNVHASLLPEYRGAAPIQRAIWDGKKTTGVTIQKMERKLDTGAILVQKSTPIGADETSGELLGRLAFLGAEALVEAVKQIEKKEERFEPQDESKATYAAKIQKEDAVVRWDLPAQSILNQIRALQPWPIAETYLGKDRLKIFRAETGQNTSKIPGEIETDHQTRLGVAAGDGRLVTLTEIQLENRKRLSIRDFMMAYRGNFPFTKVGQS